MLTKDQIYMLELAANMVERVARDANLMIRIEDRVAQEKLKLSPLYIDLSDPDDEPEVLDFSDIQEKYGGDGADDPYFTDPNKTIVALEVEAAGTVSNVGFTKKMHRVMQDAVAKLEPADYHPTMFVEYGGTYKNKIDEYEVIIGDVSSSGLIGLSAVCLLIALYFRRLVAVLIIGLLIWAIRSWRTSQVEANEFELAEARR